MALDKDRALDEALRSQSAPDDPELESLVRAAHMLADELATEPAHAAGARALFVQAVAARRRSLPLARILVPALATAAVLVGVGFLGSGSLPGDDLYRVREALAAVGVAKEPLDEADDLTASAAKKVLRAEALVDTSPSTARRLAIDALVQLRMAGRIARWERAEGRLERIEDLEDGAADVIEDAGKAQADAATEGERGSGGEDRGAADSSGPGGGDSGNSGPGGSGSSGSGGGDSGNSGPGGSGSDTSGNSGPGSGGSGGSGPG